MQVADEGIKDNFRADDVPLIDAYLNEQTWETLDGYNFLIEDSA